ncbi:MAG TPA: hypothetical protein VGG11_05670 [Xanthobacteraceae bacterium]|jgi:hypothetical protein
MLSLRGVTTGAVVLLMSGAAITGAVAQTATTDAPGKPLQLLRIIEAPARPKAVVHNRIHAALHRAVATRNLKRHTVVAEAKVEQSEPTAQDAPPPAVSMDDTDTTAPTTLAAAEPSPAPAFAPSAPAIGPLTVGNQLVDVASQADVNALDLAANKTGNGFMTTASANTTPANAAPVDAVPSDQVATKVAALSAPAAAVVSEVASKTDFFKAAAATPAPQAARLMVGSPGWIAQVMAALGGAVAAGGIAWFLIGSAPRRSYS